MEEIDLKEMFDYFLSKISWIIIAIALAVAIGNVYSMFIRVPMYNSFTTLVLVSENEGSTGYSSSDQQLNKGLVTTYSEIIKSKTVLKPVISNLDLDYTVGTLQNRITVSSVNNTEIIKITVTDPDPKVATQIANEIAEVFESEIKNFYKLNNVTVLDKAEKNLNPYNVNYIKDNAIYIMIGLVLSCGIIFIFFYFDTTIKTSEEIEKKLGLTIVGIVPKVGKE